ncbi:c-type cytochrome [Asticcacaulis biprosthecium]|uniref:c-type cytochrome n=1 Tax=Asticcacaulis biprosthecium TaxID=76891 RepID=UPI0002E54127|nr:c-type cytochrome [Asticcacaulis biprosthecium]
MSRTRTLVIAALVAGLASPVLADDVSDGQLVFKQMCSACHTATAGGKTGVGPNLFGVVGRKIGSTPGFKYSKPLTADAAAGTKWTKDSLSVFLAAPQKAKPGTAMMIAVKDEAKRTKLLAYLNTLK